MKTISEIYKEYKIMLSLQDHMLRVAAVASLVCDNFTDKVDKKNVILTCLFHDMGNIIKSDLNYFPEFLEPEGLEYWQRVKDEYIEKYGSLDEHVATEAIIKEVGLPENAVVYFQNIGFSNATKNEEGDIFEHKICNYSDMRVNPFGVVSMEERIEEGHNRYLKKGHSVASEDFETLRQSMRNVEKQIFSNCKIKPEGINDEAVKPIISELRNFVIE